MYSWTIIAELLGTKIYFFIVAKISCDWGNGHIIAINQTGFRNRGLEVSPTPSRNVNKPFTADSFRWTQGNNRCEANRAVTGECEYSGMFISSCYTRNAENILLLMLGSKEQLKSSKNGKHRK